MGKYLTWLRLDPRWKRWYKVHLALFALIWVAIALYVWHVGRSLPPFEELEKKEGRKAKNTVIYARDGTILGSFFLQENRIDVPLEKISPHAIHALIATEDKRFYKHSGLDFMGLMSVIYSRLLGQRQRGGSTITQQLARNLFDKTIGRERTVIRKVKEAIAAGFLEHRYTKEEILELYLNTVSFGGVIYGIEAAARHYFGKAALDLDPIEAATLIGMLQAPTAYNPYRNPKRSAKRANIVLRLMYQQGYLKAPIKITAKDLQAKVKQHKTTQQTPTSLAPYFKEFIRQYLTQHWIKSPYFKEWARQHGYATDKKTLKKLIYEGGLRIYTTIDPTLQYFAEKAVAEHLSEYQKVFLQHIKGREPWKKDTALLKRHVRRTPYYASLKAKGMNDEAILQWFKKRKHKMQIFCWQCPNRIKDTTLSLLDSIKYYLTILEAGLISIIPQTGEIVAWVGGIDFRFFKYDHVYQAKRQVGSTFKPFVYYTAISEGRLNPCSKIANEPITYKSISEEEIEVWGPRNADRRFGGYITLVEALQHSVNIVTARLIHEGYVTPTAVIQYARRAGITSELPKVRALGLGVADLSLYELTSAYATFANLGKYVAPLFITKITDRNGTLIEDFRTRQKKWEALDPNVAYILIQMMKRVVNGGTGSAIRWKYQLYGIEIAGKTGTSQNQSDGWFMGFTPDLVTGVWVGCSDRNVHFYSLWLGQGAKTALPIWALYYKQTYNEHPYYRNRKRARFPMPANFPYNPDSLLNCTQKEIPAEETHFINWDEEE